MDVNVEIFITSQLDSILGNASGRSNEHKQLRTECQRLKEALTGGLPQNSAVTTALTSSLASLLVTALSPKLQSPKIQEAALACLHKLVAYAFLQGETRPSGRLDEETPHGITKLVIATARACQASGSTAQTQLGVIKTLLTMSTAEHFVLHGDCLMLAIRSVFNLAVTGATEDLRRTASSALLQMLNTVVKKCQQQPDSSIQVEDLKKLQINTDSFGNISFSGGEESSWVARLALLAERGDLAGLELELGNAQTMYNYQTERARQFESLAKDLSQNEESKISENPLLERVDTPPDPRRALMRDWREEEWKRLTTEERDASIVLTAMCKLAARETGSGAGETYLHAGKLLALDMLVRVLTDPMHDWTAVRADFASVLRQPLSLVVLRNCASTYDDALVASIRILIAILFAQRLRQVMKAEIGALYPTILLKPLESAVDHRVLESSSSNLSSSQLSGWQISAALEGLAAICASPQLLVDLFVNFDCSLQSANLFERTVKVASKHLVSTSLVPSLVELWVSQSNKAGGMHNSTAASTPSAGVARNAARSNMSMTPLSSSSSTPANSKAVLVAMVHMHALKACLSTIKSLDTWAGPLKQPILYYDHSNDHKPVADVSRETQRPLNQHILQQIHGDKATKAALAECIDSFNRAAVMDSGGESNHRVVALLADALSSKKISQAQPDASTRHQSLSPNIAAFFREQNSLLDPAGIGEVLGGHSPESVAIMHAYIDGERYAGMTLDDALRALLFGFRLPGEAQKIDRIVEKFAQRYCEDNPDVYPSVDAAYLLAFAIIMLNTDVHNPMAESRISKDDFVTMCMYNKQSPDGEDDEFVPIAPREDLEALYSRIVSQEIVVRDFTSPFSPFSDAEKRKKLKSNYWRRLAKTLRYFGFSEKESQPGSSFSVDSKVYRREVYSLYQGGGMSYGTGDNDGDNDGKGPSTHNENGPLTWRMASHAEHARPMLHVTGDAIVKALSAALKSSQTVIEAGVVLQGYEQAIRLAALLRDDALCTSLTEGLAAAARLQDPPPPRSGEEARAVAALSKLISLSVASMTDSGSEEQLGGAWVVIFRAIRDLEMLRTSFLTDPRSKSESGSGFSTSSQIKSSSNNSSTSYLNSSSKTKNGMGAVLWAETAGAVPLDKVFACSVDLDGEAVVVFFRALCAVGQEELTGDDFRGEKITSGEDCFLLHRLVECASANIRKRVRPSFVWRRLWVVVSQHLVGAACLPQSSFHKRHSYVAMYAVDGLRKLADEVIGVGMKIDNGNFHSGAKKEVVKGSTTGAEAIRPLISVLRGADSAAVRELAVACIAHVMGGQPLGESGWATALHALAIAASDPSPVVAGQALDAALPACQALYVDHARLEECIGTLLAVVSRTSNVTALYSFQVLARQMATVTLNQDQDQRQVDWVILLSPLAAVARGDDRSEISDTAAAVLFQILQTHGRLFGEEELTTILKSVVFPLLTPPPPHSDERVHGTGNGNGNGNGVSNVNNNYSSSGGSLTVDRKANQPSSSSQQLPHVSALQKCPEGVGRVARHAGAHLPDLWSLASTVQNKDCIILLTVEFLCRNFILHRSSDYLNVLMRLGVEQASLGVDLFGGGEVSTTEAWTSLMDVLVQTTVASTESVRALTTILMARWISTLLVVKRAPELTEDGAGRLVDALTEVYDKAVSVNMSIEHVCDCVIDWKLDDQGLESSPDTERKTERKTEQNSQSDAKLDIKLQPMLLRQEVEGGRLLLATLQALGMRDRLIHWALTIVRNCSKILGQRTQSPSLRSALLRDAVDALCDGIENGDGVVRMDSSTKSEVFALASKLVMSADLGVKKAVQRLLKIYGEDALRKLDSWPN